MDRLQEAFAATPRERFLPPHWRSHARLDQPLTIGYGQTNSQPRTVRAMLALLDVHPGDRVLDVGAGSGWTTALLARLTGPTGSVVGTEIVPLLRAWGAGNLAGCRLPNARIEAARPDRLGWPQEAPYNRILVSAEAGALPEDLVGQLTGTGVLVLPVSGRMTRVTRTGTDPARRRVEGFGRYRFVPLVEPGG